MIGNGCIDVHAHAFSAEYVQLLAGLGAKSEVMHTTRGVFSNSHQQRIEVMDYGGVERQVLSMSAATPYFDDAASAVRAARFINDEHAEMCRRYPKRFSFFCVLPMPHAQASLTEFTRCVDELGAAGVTFTTQIGDRPLTDPAFAEIFAELDRREQVVFLHPPGLGCASPIIQNGLSWSIGAPIEDAACAMQLMQADWPRRYPRMKVILPHLGGFIAFLRYRLGRSANPDIPSPVEQMRKFWYDTANGEPAALRASIECYGIDRLVFGTDYPYWTPGTGYEQAVGYISEVGLTPDEVAAIRYGNANSIFGMVLAGR